MATFLWPSRCLCVDYSTLHTMRVPWHWLVPLRTLNNRAIWTILRPMHVLKRHYKFYGFICATYHSFLLQWKFNTPLYGQLVAAWFSITLPTSSAHTPFMLQRSKRLKVAHICQVWGRPDCSRNVFLPLRMQIFSQWGQRGRYVSSISPPLKLEPAYNLEQKVLAYIVTLNDMH